MADLEFGKSSTVVNTALEHRTHVVVPCRDGKSCVAAELGGVWKSAACGKAVKRENRQEMSLAAVPTAAAESIAAELRGMEQ